MKSYPKESLKEKITQLREEVVLSSALASRFLNKLLVAVIEIKPEITRHKKKIGELLYSFFF